MPSHAALDLWHLNISTIDLTLNKVTFHLVSVLHKRHLCREHSHLTTRINYLHHNENNFRQGN